MSKKKVSGSSFPAGTGGFISFSDVVNDYSDDKPKSKYTTSTDSNISVLYTGSDPVLTIACKRLLKKDINTKLKSISEIIQVLGANKGGDESIFTDFMPYFSFAFSKLIYEDSIQVRLGLSNILATICDVNKKALAPSMDDLIGGWWQMMSDPSSDVHQSFQSSFQSAFPPKRRQVVVQHMSKRIFDHLIKNLEMIPADLKAMTQCNDEDLQEKYDRVIISCLGGFMSLIDQLSVTELESRLFDVDHRAQRFTSVQSIIRLHASSSTMDIKKALSQMISTIVDKVPDALQSSIDVLRTYCLDNLDDRSAVLDSTFHVLVALAKNWENFYDKGGYLMNILQKISGLCRSNVPMVHEKVLEFLLPFTGTVSFTKLSIYTEIPVESSISTELPSGGNNNARKQPKLMKVLLSILSEEASASARSNNSASTMAKSTYLLRLIRVIECAVFLLLRKLPETATSFEVNISRVEELLTIIQAGIVHVLEALSSDDLSWRRAGSQDNQSIHSNTSSLIRTLFVLHRATNQQQIIVAASWNKLLWHVIAEKLAVQHKMSLSFLDLLRSYLYGLSETDKTLVVSWDNGIFMAVSHVVTSLLQEQEQLSRIQTALQVVELLLMEPFPECTRTHVQQIMIRCKSSWLIVILNGSMVSAESNLAALSLLHQLLRGSMFQAYPVVSSSEIVTQALAVGSASALLLAVSHLTTPSSLSSSISESDVPKLTYIKHILFTLGTSEESLTLTVPIMEELGGKLLQDLRLSSIENRVALLFTLWCLSSIEEQKALMLQAVRNWQDEQSCSKLCQWFVLSLIMSSFASNNSSEWETFISTNIFAQRILRILSSAVAVANNNSNTSISTTGTVLFNQQETLVTSASHVETKLVPFLPMEVKRTLITNLFRQLESDFQTLITVSHASTITVDIAHNMNKWVQQVTLYASFLEKYHEAVSEQQQSLVLSTFAPSFWQTLCQLKEGNNIETRNVSVILTLWQALLTTRSCASSWSAALVVSVCIALFRIEAQNHHTRCADADTTASLSALIASLHGTTLSVYQQVVPDSNLQLRRFLLADFHSTCKPFTAESILEVEALHALFGYLRQQNHLSPSSHTTISLELAHGGLRGQRVWYLQRQTQDVEETVIPTSMQLSLVEAVITGVHLENGPEQPYYTIQLQDDSGRELQTEWWRLQVSSDDVDVKSQCTLSLYLLPSSSSTTLSKTASLTSEINHKIELLLLNPIDELEQRYGHDSYVFRTVISLLLDNFLHEQRSAMLETSNVDIIRYLQSYVVHQLKEVSSSAVVSNRIERETQLERLLLLLPAVVANVISVSDTSQSSSRLWLQEIYAWIYHDVLSQSTRLAHDADYWTRRIRLLSGLAEYVHASVGDVISEKKLFPAGLVLLRMADDESRSTTVSASSAAKIHGSQQYLSQALCQFWSRQGVQRLSAVDPTSSAVVVKSALTADAVAGLFPVRAWEPTLVSRLVHDVFMPTASPSSLLTQYTQLLAVQGAMLGRNRRELMQLCTYEATFASPAVVSALFACACSMTDSEASGSDTQSVYGALIAPSKRLLAGKLLDVFYAHDQTAKTTWSRVASQLQHSGERLQQNGATAIESSTSVESTSDDIELTESELMKRDESVFTGVIEGFGGDFVSQWMTTMSTRFNLADIMARMAISLASAGYTHKAADDEEEEGEGEGDEEEADREESEKEEGQVNAAAVVGSGKHSPVTPSKLRSLVATPPITPAALLPSSLRANSTYSRRARRHFCVQDDPLGSVLLWLVSLQAIDSAATAGPARNSLRAQCGMFLQKSGYFEEVMSLLLALSGDALTKTSAMSAGASVDSTAGATTATTSSSSSSSSSNNSSVLHAFQRLVHLLPPVSPSSSTAGSDDLFAYHRQSMWDITRTSSSSSSSSSALNLQSLAIYAIYRTIITLPAMTRTFWSSDQCSRRDKLRLSKFVEEKVRGQIIRREIALIEASSASGSSSRTVAVAASDSADVAAAGVDDQFAVVGNSRTGQITASFMHDEVAIDLIISLPPTYPLKNVDVSCTRRIGVTEARWRRWVLQMIQLLSMQDGAVIDATLLWRSNILTELQGVEPCPICYCTLHTKTLKLPSFNCPTCKHGFHPSCLQTWFKTSGKNKCVLCQQPISL